jgi:D-arabinose 1-dehydrogenase-like Zn-dependent alcohol dehydrogenase
LVRVKAAGLCHSDLSVINGDRPRPTPMALGHEAAGIVEELGPGIDDLAPGPRLQDHTPRRHHDHRAPAAADRDAAAHAR